ncbi:MAG: glycosyltransferase family 2 protein [bacterium]|nr:glycosyltransferase family 2 protein [bacterium]
MNASIIIVNWNTGPMLRECLDSLPGAFSNNEEYEVFVIDNASVDQSVAIAEGSPQKIQLFKVKKNLGFAKANNIGIRQSKGDYVILLNPDTVATEGCFTKLIAFLQEKPKVAAVGPRLLNADLSWQPSCRSFPSVGVLAAMFLKLPHFFPNMVGYRKYLMKDFTYESETVVDQIMGACMVIPRDMLDRIGLLDEKYWIWFEEVDWCRRAKELGLEIWFAPVSEIVHYGGVSFKQAFVPVRKEWRFMRSALRYVRKHIGIRHWLLLCLIAPLGLIIDSLTMIVWLKPSAKNSTK